MRSAGFQRQFSTKGQGGCDYVWTDQSAVVLMSRPWGDACGHAASPCLHTLSPTPLLRVFQPAIWTPPVASAAGSFSSCPATRWGDPLIRPFLLGEILLPKHSSLLLLLFSPGSPDLPPLQACFASHRLQNHLGRAAALGPTAEVCLFPPHV